MDRDRSVETVPVKMWTRVGFASWSYRAVTGNGLNGISIFQYVK